MMESDFISKDKTTKTKRTIPPKLTCRYTTSPIKTQLAFWKTLQADLINMKTQTLKY
jgi:hypothetical protein